jgi:ribA/ribD-fused uncharacterized protein
MKQFKDDDGVSYNSAEQYMMAQKALVFGDTQIHNEIMTTRNPRDQKAWGRKVRNYEDKVWSEKRYEVVIEATRLKFKDSELRKELLSTGDKVLVEASPEDPIWGIGLHFNDDDVLDEAKWKGQNLLGKAIMVIRKAIVDTKREMAYEAASFNFTTLIETKLGTCSFCKNESYALCEHGNCRTCKCQHYCWLD